MPKRVFTSARTAASVAPRSWYSASATFLRASRGDHPSTADREAEVEAALEILGAHDHRVLHRGEEHHLRLDARPVLELASFVEQAIAELAPHVVVIPCLGHYHQDHRATHEACLAALRPAPAGRRHRVETVLTYGHHHDTWAPRGTRFEPTAFLDISEVLDQKVRALEAYASQVLDPPAGRSPDGVRAWARQAGFLAGCTYAEGFEVLRLTL